MIKKVVKAFSFFALLQILVYSCCNETYNVYYEQVSFLAIDMNEFSDDTIASEDLVLHIDFSYNYIKISELIDLKDFSNSAYATSCDEDYFFKDSITSIIVVASETLFDIEAGDSLNDKLVFINPDTLENESIDNLVTFLNNDNQGFGYNKLDMVFNETIPSDTVLSFNIQIQLEGGRSLVNSTEMITIE